MRFPVGALCALVCKWGMEVSACAVALRAVGDSIDEVLSISH